MIESLIKAIGFFTGSVLSIIQEISSRSFQPDIGVGTLEAGTPLTLRMRGARDVADADLKKTPAHAQGKPVNEPGEVCSRDVAEQAN